MRDFRDGPNPEKLKALLAVAEQVQIDGKRVTPELIAEARQHGATDFDTHDTALIAAAFCMHNRYVDGLATCRPTGTDLYRGMSSMMTERGYSRAEV